MTLSVSRLLDIGLNVDTSGLESFLDGIRSRLDGLQDRIADLENDGSGMDKSEVEQIAQDVVDSAGILDESDVERIAQDMGFIKSSDAYDAVSDQVYDMVKDIVREDLDEKDFADRDHDHTGEYATTDSVDELEGRVTEVEQTLESVLNGNQRYDERLVALEARDGHDHSQDYVAVQALVARIESLEADRAEHLRLIQDLQESSSGATRFFKLAVQMLDIVRESVGR